MKLTVIVHLIAGLLYGIGGILLVVSGVDLIANAGIFSEPQETFVTAVWMFAGGFVLAVVNMAITLLRFTR